jgi:hypothetical protein
MDFCPPRAGSDVRLQKTDSCIYTFEDIDQLNQLKGILAEALKTNTKVDYLNIFFLC